MKKVDFWYSGLIKKLAKLQFKLVISNIVKVLFLLLLLNPIALNSQVLFKLPKADTLKQLPPLKELQNDLESIINDQILNNAFIGISVMAPETNEIFFQKNEHKNFIPASNQKILTTATAVRYLGANYRFQTRMYLDGDINEKGEFIGDIYIRGFGDPSLSDYFSENPFAIFNYYYKMLDSLGIKVIDGDIIGDDNFFDDLYYASGWQIDDMIYTFSSQINALSILDNKISITVESGKKPGNATTISIFPNLSYTHIVNNSVTSLPEQLTNLNVTREICTNNIQINGNIAFDSSKIASNTLTVTIDNPTLYFLYIFKDYLEKNNIRHKGGVSDIDELNFLPDYTFLEKNFTFFSPKLSDIIKIINRESHNLAAEMLLKTIARETTGFGSTVNGIEQVKKYLSKLVGASDKIYIVDGSGLSRMNMITPDLLTTILNNMYKSEHRNIFLTSLAAPNESGTMKRRLTKSAAEKRVRVKTGTMNNVSTISGYVKSRDDETIIFSIMVNNFTCPLSKIQNIQDLICMRLAAFTRHPERFPDK